MSGASRTGQSTLPGKDRLCREHGGRDSLRRPESLARAVSHGRVLAQFEKVARGWQSGIPDLEAAVGKAPSQRRDEAEAELRFARTAAIHFQSVVNQVRYVAARDALADRSKRLSAEQRRRLREVVESSLKSEIALCAGCSRWSKRIRGSASRPRISISTSPWTWRRRWSTAAGCWNRLRSNRRQTANEFLLRKVGCHAHARVGMFFMSSLMPTQAWAWHPLHQDEKRFRPASIVLSFRRVYFQRLATPPFMNFSPSAAS